MVGQINKKEEIKRALKAYIMRDREKQRLGMLTKWIIKLIMLRR